MSADMQINQVLAQMRSLAETSGLGNSQTQAPEGVNFGQMLKQSLDQVNQTQQAASEMRHAFELGDPNVNLVEVMVATQKSSIAFEAVNQVRNRLLSAYQEIMRMPV